jgi:hypothetical protein
MQKMEQNTWNGEKKHKMTKEDDKLVRKHEKSGQKAKNKREKSGKRDLWGGRIERDADFKLVGYLFRHARYPSGRTLLNQHLAEPRSFGCVTSVRTTEPHAYRPRGGPSGRFTLKI